MKMMQNDTRVRIDGKLLGKINALKGELLKLDTENAIFVSDWYIHKLVSARKHSEERFLKNQIKNGIVSKDKVKADLDKVKKKNFPYNLKHGDIINVHYGFGFTDEINDTHYAVVLSRKGEMFLVAPLTSKVQDFGSNTLYFENLNLPSATGVSVNKSYVSFSQIKYVHSRRIEVINRLPKKDKGRKQLANEQTKQILDNYKNIITEGIEYR
jgi:mRNA-degrading endonuclease toxin of MazEF toxin-antitoxin module